MKNLKVFNAKRVIFSFLVTIMLSLSGCFESGENIQTFELVPAVVGYSSQLFQPTIITPFGTFIAPELQKDYFVELMEGDAILTSFYINYDQQSSTEYIVASNVLYSKVEKGWPQSTNEGQSTGDYDVPIENMVLYGGIENIWFFVFRHTASSNQKFAYEMTYDSNVTDDIPVVYIRARKDGQGGSENTTTFDFPYAFNMNYFFTAFKDASNKVKFKIK